MSTYWHFECLSHNPPLPSASEFTQHSEDEAYWEGIALAHGRPLAPMPDEWWVAEDNWHSKYYERQARRFLEAHPTCKLGILSEYGEHLPVPSPVEKKE